MEQWRPVPDLEEYAVSTLGRVKRVLPKSGAVTGRILRPYLDRKGYLRVRLADSRLETGRQADRRIHRLVYSVFCSEIPEGYEINHKDGNKTNNALGNLECCTSQENHRHAAVNGLKAIGEHNGSSKLTVEAVRNIRRLAEEGVTQRRIAESFSISRRTAWKIIRGINWKLA